MRESLRPVASNVDVDQSDNVEEAIDAILATAAAAVRVLRKPGPLVQVVSLARGVGTLSVKAWVNNVQFSDVQADIMKAV